MKTLGKYEVPLLGEKFVGEADGVVYQCVEGQCGDCCHDDSEGGCELAPDCISVEGAVVACFVRVPA